MTEFDVAVIGAGVAGEVLAGRLSEKRGRRVAIFENHPVGWECAVRVPLARDDVRPVLLVLGPAAG
jgi:pyruvate/2-oxoglutarate dehydrogenase complex dihydrolipoamide dehydrogenase (E3) component